MLQSRRNPLQQIKAQQAQHAGLWLDKYLSEQLPKNESVGDKTPQQRLVEETCADIREPESYAPFFERWRAALEGLAGAQCQEAEVQGRLAVGLGDESVIETSVTLHRTYGLPYIPGSALKGLAASFARQRLDNPLWHKEKDTLGDAYEIMFGSTKEAGFVTFCDALYVPGSGHAGQFLYPDVITVHHQEYYQNKGQAPADWDNPNPVSFLSATGKYLIALVGPDEWVKAAFDILAQALREVGVGAKTSSGYGRLRFGDGSLGIGGDEGQVTGATVPETLPEVEQFRQGLAAIPHAYIAGQIFDYVKRWREAGFDEPYRQELGEAILAKIEEAPGKSQKKMKMKPWYEALLASLSEGAKE